MASTLVDRVKITVMSSGTGPFELGAPVPAYRGVEALTGGATYAYAVESNSLYEAGTGTYVAGSGTFLRVPQISSNGGSTVAFPANVQLVFTALAADYGAGAGAEAGAAAGAIAGAAAGATAGAGAVSTLAGRLASPDAGDGSDLVAKSAQALRPVDFGAVPGSGANATAALEAMFASALAQGIERIDGQGLTYYVSGLEATVSRIAIDNITFKEKFPNTGAPRTVTLIAETDFTGYVYLGPTLRVDRSGDGLVSDLDNSWGLQVQKVNRVDAHCEIFGNARGNGLWVQQANWLYDNSYVHDMLCDHTGLGPGEDIQHGSWAWLCEYVVTRGLVQHLGSLDRSSPERDRRCRGRAYSGCKNVSLGGSVGPGIDQAYDVTGDARNGNTCVRLDGAHADYPFSHGLAMKNAVMAVSSGVLTVREPGLCSVLLSSPATPMVNMTMGAIVTGITQIGGGANQIFAPEGSVVRLNVQGVQGYPKNVRITGNLLVGHGGPTTFTVADTDELTPNNTPGAGTGPLNVSDCARVRLTTTGTLPTPLATATNYWIVLADNGNFHLCTSFNNAQDGVFITGLTGGTGTHTITIQNDVNYGVISEVTSGFDKYAPNLVYGNAFGPVIGKQANVKDMIAVLSNSTTQNIPETTATYLVADTIDDAYGIVTDVGSGVFEVEFPFEGNWELYTNGLWSSGPAVGVSVLALFMDTGSGFVEVQGYTQQTNCIAQDWTQTLPWQQYARKGWKARIRVSQNCGNVGGKSFSLKKFYVKYLPGG